MPTEYSLPYHDDTALHADDYSLNPGHDFTRNRKLSLASLIRSLIAMEGNSINNELYDIFNPGSDDGQFVTKSAFVQQRRKLKHEALRNVLHGFNRHTEINDTNRHDGYKLYAIDGTDVNIAYNEDSDTYFQGNGNNVTGKGFKQFHMNALFDITNSTFHDAVIQPSPKENEIEATRQLVRNLDDKAPRIFIIDCGYCSLDLIATMQENPQSDYIIRARSNFIREARNLPEAECDFDVSFTITTRQTNENKETIRKGLMKFMLIIGMFPGFLGMICIYKILQAVGLQTSIFGLFLVYIAGSAMNYYISKGFFDTIPRSLDEAALIDGANRNTVFWRIIIPLSKPIVVYTVLTAFLAPWGDFMMANYLVGRGSQEAFTVAVGLQKWIQPTLSGVYFTRFCAGGVFVSIPIVVLFFWLQRYYVEGVTGGAVKG